jgi:hypothetical protein
MNPWTAVGVDFRWKDIVIGADLDAVEFAYDNKYFLIKNRDAYHHSYEDVEDVWAEKSYQLYNLGLVPFVNKINNLRVLSEDKLIKVFTDSSVFTIQYENIYVFDFENVVGPPVDREFLHYRVIDWFDCRGLHNLEFDEIVTNDDFVHKIKLFQSLRIDGDQKYMDLLCESFLSEDQLKIFEFSDTMVRFKAIDLLKTHGAPNVKMALWKRDIYPVYDRMI